ncbi:DUF1571 domain-containing protein [Tundrisphaera sp. TA3]|uniref:DUF1571 domain-containing protein n=1 Tax=Tundrisphaera sp. TA3 TaxID=3435775 RepID=UPI003EBE8094
MTVPTSKPERSRSRRWRYLLAAPLVPASLVGGAMWWFTAPLEDHPAAIGTGPVAEPTPAPAAPAAEVAPAWPDGRLEGEPAKTLLLAILDRAAARLARHEGYTATFRKQERIGGELLPEQTLAMKLRNRPFAVYFKFLAPRPGKEVVFAEGHHDNKVIAHNGDWTRRLVPRLAIDPGSSLALADNRHPITEAGLLNLTNRLVAFRRMDLQDSDAGTILDRTEDGRWLRSVHTHTIPNPERPFARVEVLYDPTTMYPAQISSYDWPKPGQGGDLLLAERYAYENVRFDPTPTAADFDPANPDYAFHRF